MVSGWQQAAMDAATIDWSLPTLAAGGRLPIDVRLRTVLGAEHHAVEALGVLEPLQQKYTLAGVARIHAVYCVFRHEHGPFAVWKLSAAGPDNYQKAQAMVAAYQNICQTVTTKPYDQIKKAYPFVDPLVCMVDECATATAGQGQGECRHRRTCDGCPMRGLQVQASQRSNRCVGHELLRCNSCRGPLWCGRVDARFRLAGRYECEKCTATLCSLCKRDGHCACALQAHATTPVIVPIAVATETVAAPGPVHFV
jgi:hypothetical protein